uniref:Uncharacterized protein n=1 Tax=Knipowitschia caucasica TaxID=637954 RepID=A0AAV2LRH1_KNICA
MEIQFCDVNVAPHPPPLSPSLPLSPPGSPFPLPLSLPPLSPPFSPCSTSLLVTSPPSPCFPFPFLALPPSPPPPSALSHFSSLTSPSSPRCPWFIFPPPSCCIPSLPPLRSLSLAPTPSP